MPLVTTPMVPDAKPLSPATIPIGHPAKSADTVPTKAPELTTRTIPKKCTANIFTLSCQLPQEASF